jgi:hypothetical protein
VPFYAQEEWYTEMPSMTKSGDFKNQQLGKYDDDT